MNYIALAIGVLGIYPLALVARKVGWVPAVLSGLIGLLPFLGFDALTFDFFQQPYRGEARSLEISVLDLIAAALYFALPEAKQPSPYRASRYTYFAIVLFSLTVAPIALHSLFSVGNLVRAYFLLGVVTRLAEKPELANALGRGLALGVVYSAGLALRQRYVDGMFQVTGGFEHANSLGMAVNLVAPIALAVLLETKFDKLAFATIAGAAICVVLALSRGALMMFGFACGLVILGSLYRQVTRRKIYITILLAFGTLLVLGKSADSIVERFVTAPAASVAARDRFEDAAQAMVEDNVFGVGINQYSYVLEHRGYADEFEMPPVDRDGLAHHIYWLTAAELGWLGLLVYLWLIATPWWTAAWGALRSKGDVRGAVMLGCAAGMTVMHAHGVAEWAARQSSLMYIFWTIAGLAAAMSRSVKRAPGENAG
ncbi:MAG: O-antigen ligase family protein [Deltaproteobacteria bacterium]|nr:O-antigen ligase family protein [Deltaproteobacteria bacterium]